MLNTLRKGAATWVAKILMGLLILSFGVWGIADIFTGYGQRTLVKVGDVEIPPEQFEEAMQQQLRGLSRQLGQQLTMDQARAFGLDRQVLNSLITNAAIDQQATSLGLGISDAMLREEIQNMPAFKGADGKFDRQQFIEVLRNNNLNEAMFIRDQRVGSIREQLVTTIAADSFVPSALLEAQNRYDNDTRTVDYFILPLTAVGTLPEPDESAMKTFLDGNKQKFTAPETRKLGVLTLAAAAIRAGLTVSDEEAAAYYGEHIDQFTLPGKRHLLRMSFLDREQAADAKKELDGGADFMAVATKYGFKKEGADLGFVDRAGLNDPELANAAFALKEGEISAPVAGDLYTSLVKVVAIDKNSVVRPLAEVKDQVRETMLAERTAEQQTALQDNIEDARANGRSLQDIAAELKLSYKMTEAVDQAGKGPDGKPVAGFENAAALLDAAFGSDVGVDNDPVEGEGETLSWFEVLAVTPERVRALDEVKPEVVAGWKAQERESRHAKLAADLFEKLNGGKTLAEIAKPYKADVKTTKPFKRGEEHDDIPPAAVTRAFAEPVGGHGVGLLDKERGRVLFRVAAKSAAGAPDKETAEKLGKRLREQIEGDLVSQYVSALRGAYGVSVNQQILQRLTGAAE